MNHRCLAYELEYNSIKTVPRMKNMSADLAKARERQEEMYRNSPNTNAVYAITFTTFKSRDGSWNEYYTDPCAAFAIFA